VIENVGAAVLLGIVSNGTLLQTVQNICKEARTAEKAEDLTVRPRELNIIRVRPGTEAFMVYCPECESDLDIEEDEVDEGEVVSCPECGTDFEIVTVNPLELKPVAEEEDEEEEEEEEAEDGDL
jgi:alpha-aminoadipate carrier protein LysW